MLGRGWQHTPQMTHQHRCLLYICSGIEHALPQGSIRICRRKYLIRFQDGTHRPREHFRLDSKRPSWTPRAIGSGGLRASGTKASALTPPPHQPPLLGEPSSRAEARRRAPWPSIGRLVSGAASGLDAFSPYPLGRGCPASPCRRTGTPLAPALRSSRTRSTFPSGGHRPRQVESDLPHGGLNPAHVPL